jgi:HEAT repeat protein
VKTALLLALALLPSGCSGPSSVRGPALFDAIAERRALIDAALETQEAFRMEVEGATLGRLVRENFEEVLEGLRSPDPARQEAAAFALGFSRNRAAVEPLVEAAASDRASLRAFAIASVGMLGFRDTPTGPFLKLLADDAWQVRLSALFGIRHFVTPGSPAALVQAVGARLTDPVTGVRNEAVLVLAKVATPAALELILTRAVGDPEPLVRQNAARALGAIRRPAEKILPVLAELSRDGDPRVADAADASLRWVQEGRVDTPALDR